MASSSDLPDSSTLPESLRLLSLIWSFDAALERTSLAMAATIGVTGQQRFLLRFVGLAPGITRDQLAHLISRDPAELQSVLDALLSKNLLTRSSGNEGFYLTGQGAVVNGVMTGTVEQAVSKALDEASPTERTSFRRLLERVLGHLGTTRA
jgi:DNA-binding MarR family transcriptional regulator